jgi:cyanophycinase
MVGTTDGPAPGALALVGSGEYTAAMDGTDRALLETLGGPGAAQVVVLPTAAGHEEPASPARWAREGVQHFTRLGAQVQPAMILNRADADDPRWLELLESANFYYFSGGDPQYLAATLAGSPSWDVIRRRHAAGAVLAGCSAGAMAFGGWIPNMRAAFTGRAADWHPALGIVPQLMVLPHFDRMANFIGRAVLWRMVQTAPAGACVIGVDENTALVRFPATADSWQVWGQQTVSVFGGPGNGGSTVYRTGQRVVLADI